MSSHLKCVPGATLAVLLLGGVSGCSGGVSVGTPPTSRSTPAPDGSARTARARAAGTARAQRPGTCEIAPPSVRLPTGEWTATKTILSTNAIDVCAGERQSRPMDFRRRCAAGRCKTYLFSASYYGMKVAEVVPAGRGRYVATFRPTPVPCPHRPGEDTGTNWAHLTITLRWSPDRQSLHGLGRDRQVGPCGGGPAEVSSYVVRRTNPTANPPAEGP